MKKFFKEFEVEIFRVKVYERKVLGYVREVIEYFYGDTVKEEAYFLRIFLIVRDFLFVLDNVCKEVGRMEDRIVMGIVRFFRIFVYVFLLVFIKYNVRYDDSLGDESMFL